jgi:hypothetical protein
LSGDGKRLPDGCPTHVALAENVGNILHPRIDPLECTIVSGQSL